VTLDLFTNNYRRNAFTIFNTDRADYVAKSSRPTRRERPIFVSENRSLSYVDRCWTSGAPEVCICVFIRTGVRPYVPSRAYTQEIGGGVGFNITFRHSVYSVVCLLLRDTCKSTLFSRKCKKAGDYLNIHLLYHGRWNSSDVSKRTDIAFDIRLDKFKSHNTGRAVTCNEQQRTENSFGVTRNERKSTVFIVFVGLLEIPKFTRLSSERRHNSFVFGLQIVR